MTVCPRNKKRSETTGTGGASTKVLKLQVIVIKK